MPRRDTATVRLAFGRVLRARREAVGISQEALALNADLSTSYVKLLERGQRQPALAAIIALATVLGCSAAELVAEVEKG
jgi:transcriptional regulator with XRE-family HTH domain